MKIKAWSRNDRHRKISLQDSDCEHFLTIDEAKALRDALTAALNDSFIIDISKDKENTLDVKHMICPKAEECSCSMTQFNPCNHRIPHDQNSDCNSQESPCPHCHLHDGLTSRCIEIKEPSDEKGV